MKNNVGVLLPISALPGTDGIGDFGHSAYQFVDWLKEHHYRYWQILPLNPVGPGNSPYLSFCSSAIDVRYISLELLTGKSSKNKEEFVDYKKALDYKSKILKKYYLSNFSKDDKDYKKFKKENQWASDYSLYLSLRKKNHNQPWNKWNENDINFLKNNKKKIETITDEFQIWLQYIALKQWNGLFKYANENGIEIIADCPFYVGLDSVDCWIHHDEFLFNKKNEPTFVGGCPPDAFSDDGQLWGNPIYNFKKMKKNNYSFLVNRIGELTKRCNHLRLDHFRAWDTYCVIPAKDKNAKRGVWKNGPREDFFKALYHKHPNINLIAEDLGELFPSVHELRDSLKLPGMYVLQFSILDWEAFSNKTQIVYPGTHDNPTLYGWFKSLNEQQIKTLNKRLNYPTNLYKGLFDYVWNTDSYMTIIPLQDLLKLDNKARINAPGTVNDHNWCWKLKDMSWVKSVKFGQ